MSAQSGKNGKSEKAGAPLFDRELEHLPQALRWREWMARVEAVIFAAPEPVSRETLTQVIGRDCSLDLIIEDISAELADRPYELVRVAGGWQHRTRPAVADAIRSAFGIEEQGESLSEAEALVLMTIGYFQPITRSELSSFFAREISRDLIGKLRRAGFIASGPRSPQPGAPYTYVTTPGFLAHFGFETLRDLPDFEKLEDAGLLNKEKLLGDIPGAMERW
ncbi:SMC-Scp complex subunit ScpB [Nitratireductor aquimarinus]|uniref:SMC-Scp complex subunit ScpB n=1 Tax=Nitratireductor TaxID=245876 RepID=UPI0019D3404F|nr:MULTISPECIES: SMC-Scp complex subunit ScpB [Nitratireductor]MBN7776183.1 SMC-Scp complex subunit ScpB [Nitratireductor pacificus]MBN7779050.1 SMC-Scp complex subunit ScpB [Nitratireductor pacificus]MBN7787857.1 SMC-Scp complex subunit ScpB [Nitratireductor aquimarinus]MBY6097904.1 SMC-Scp complex subunit ScpB [Nitratireductor aquimarinus]MCA1261631.1 SMC-Scp complex subunit ScpB [Nitratireductor aquimarinus]